MEGRICAATGSATNNTSNNSRFKPRLAKNSIQRSNNINNIGINNINNNNNGKMKQLNRINSFHHHKNGHHRSTFRNSNGHHHNNNNFYMNNVNNNNVNHKCNLLKNNLFNTQEMECKKSYLGEFTREVYNAIQYRLRNSDHIPADSVQAFFNDMHLYPPKSFVLRMIQTARQYSRPNVTQDYLTFGEFCVLVKELRRTSALPQYKHRNSSTCEVFLGGSCNPTTWRADIAIPTLKKNGISYYNPQVATWAPELLEREHDAKEAAEILFFVIDSQTRSTVGMVEVAYLTALGRFVVVVKQPYKLGQSIMGETISDSEFEDLDKAQNTLMALLQIRNIQIHSNLQTALEFTMKILGNSTSPVTKMREEQVVGKLRKLREVYEDYVIGNISLAQAYEKLTNHPPDPIKLNKSLLPSNNGNVVSFEQFCIHMADFSLDGCDNNVNTINSTTATTSFNASTGATTTTTTNTSPAPPTTDAWTNQIFQRQCSTTINNNNGCDFISNPTYDIFLGGSLSSNVRWQQEIAIPLLKKHGLTYYNPAVREVVNNSSEYVDNLMNERNLNGGSGGNNDVLKNVEKWKNVIDRSDVLLFVITNDTRSMTSLVLAAYCLGLKRKVVLCIQHLSEDSIVKNETLTKNAVKDYNRARVYVTDWAKRKGFPVFENIADAVQSAISSCSSNKTITSNSNNTIFNYS